jgi:hypothetical protein
MTEHRQGVLSPIHWRLEVSHPADSGCGGVGNTFTLDASQRTMVGARMREICDEQAKERMVEGE